MQTVAISLETVAISLATVAIGLDTLAIGLDTVAIILKNKVISKTSAVASCKTYYKEIAVASGNTTVSDYVWTRVSVSLVKYDFGNLVPGTNYAVRIGAVSKTGQVFYSDIVYCICS